jgi:tRNA(Ile)-lysidine synthase
MHSASPLQERFLSRLRDLGVGDAPSHLLVAVSGGCDSVALLHLLREASRAISLTLSVAHLDHGMRPGSAGDARWVRGLCAAWDLPHFERRLPEAPRSEADARAARYDFLRELAARIGAGLVATAHSADDQAETVLFRAARGTGLRGLSGIPARTRSGLIRPLLPFWRAEIRAYAAAHELRWRTDPTNRDLRFARNRIRRRILPELERFVAPGARRNLVALAALAAEADAALRRLARDAEATLVRRDGTDFLLARARLRDYDPALASRVLRSVLRRSGSAPGRAGTRAALQFINDAPSGRRMRLPGGVAIAIEFGDARVSRISDPGADEPVEIDATDRGAVRSFRLGGSSYRLRVGDAAPTRPDGWTVRLDPRDTRFPLRIRAWRPGDRVTTTGGTKSLKKLFLEERIPRSRRATLPVLTDATGRVLWVAGIARDLLTMPRGDERAFSLTIVND